MRAITVRQPWAWAIIHGGKDVENRSRNIAGNYRGPVAIHAGLVNDIDSWQSLARTSLAAWSRAMDSRESLLAGAIIGVVDLVDVHDSEDCWTKDLRRVRALYANDRAAFDALPSSPAGGVIGKVKPCSPWGEADCWHLVLSNPRPLTKPIPCRGRLGLWTVPDEVAARIETAS